MCVKRDDTLTMCSAQVLKNDAPRYTTIGAGRVQHYAHACACAAYPVTSCDTWQNASRGYSATHFYNVAATPFCAHALAAYLDITDACVCVQHKNKVHSTTPNLGATVTRAEDEDMNEMTRGYAAHTVEGGR